VGKPGLDFSLGAFTTVFQAEVFAIMAAVRKISREGTMVGKSRYLLTARLS